MKGFFPAAALTIVLATGCGSPTPTSPSSTALVTLALGNEIFRVTLTTPDQVAAAPRPKAARAHEFPSVALSATRRSIRAGVGTSKTLHSDARRGIHQTKVSTPSQIVVGVGAEKGNRYQAPQGRRTGGSGM
jgi:hypothetical protein